MIRQDEVRTPPQSVEAEQAVLGGLMLDANAWDAVADIIAAADFYRRDHRLIFEAIAEVAEIRGSCDAVTISEHLDRKGRLDEVGGLAYLGTIAREEGPESGRPRWRAIWAAALASAADSSGLLLAMVLPTAFLGLAAIGWLDEYVAYYIALWVGTGVLAVIGWVTAARRGGPWGWYLLSALVTASLGLLVIWLSALVH